MKPDVLFSIIYFILIFFTQPYQVGTIDKAIKQHLLRQQFHNLLLLKGFVPDAELQGFVPPAELQ